MLTECKIAPLIFLFALWQPVSNPQEERVAFLKDGQVYVSDGNVANVNQISNDPSKKQLPRWSPDGTKVVYGQPATSDRSIGELVVVDATGALVGRYPVATVTDAGVPIDGMHYLEKLGWLDDEHVFATGNVNPYLNEYRTISIKSRKIGGFAGFDFKTCSAAGVVTFWEPVFPQSTTMKLVTTLTKAPLFESPNPQDLPTLHVPLAWDYQCKSVAFVDPRPPVHLVVISVADKARASLPIPITLGRSSLRAAREGFLVGSDGQFLYKSGTSELEPTPASVLDELRNKASRRRNIEETLGASDADWWPR